LLVMGGFAAMKLRLRYLALLIVLAVGTALLPPVWCRICSLKKEFDCSQGGRIVMWTKIAPPLIAAHPLGIGYRALTPELMKQVADEQGVVVEAERDHLHSNPVQVLVSLGWAGLAVYLLWMGGAIFVGIQVVRSLPVESAERTGVLSLVLMLAALIMNGLIEYNLGDAELVVPYAVLLGTLMRPNKME
jgi:O-antigen ligase